MILISTIVVSVFLILIDLVTLYKEQQWKAFFVYSIFLCLYITLAFLMEFNIDVSSLSDISRKIILFILGSTEK